jgi:hypothetical protein
LGVQLYVASPLADGYGNVDGWLNLEEDGQERQCSLQAERVKLYCFATDE